MKAFAALAAVSLAALSACATTMDTETPASHVNTLELAEAAVAVQGDGRPPGAPAAAPE